MDTDYEAIEIAIDHNRFEQARALIAYRQMIAAERQAQALEHQAEVLESIANMTGFDGARQAAAMERIAETLAKLDANIDEIRNQAIGGTLALSKIAYSDFAEVEE